jgi:pimeloyl-ACP methyl ester carboxylesterase
MERITVDGATLACDVQGEGEPLVLVHGTGARASSWGRTVADLAAGGYRVFAYDRRGYGRSVHPPVRDYRVHVADLATVLEVAGAPAHVLGWSSGGTTALALATQRGALFRSLVVMEPPWHGLRGARPDMLAALARVKFAQLRGRREQAAAAFFRWAAGYASGGNGFDTLSDAARAELYAAASNVLAELDPHPHGLMMEHVPTSRLARLPCRVTWLDGEDTLDWYRDLRAKAVAAAPRIRTATVPGAKVGHLAHVEAPQAFAETVLKALATASG